MDALFFGYTNEDGKKIKGRIQKFYEGAAGSAAKALGGEEAGLGPHLLKELSHEPWYVQAIAQKLLPTLQRAGELNLTPRNLLRPATNPD